MHEAGGDSLCETVAKPQGSPIALVPCKTKSVDAIRSLNNGNIAKEPAWDKTQGALCSLFAFTQSEWEVCSSSPYLCSSYLADSCRPERSYPMLLVLCQGYDITVLVDSMLIRPYVVVVIMSPVQSHQALTIPVSAVSAWACQLSGKLRMDRDGGEAPTALEYAAVQCQDRSNRQPDFH